MLDAHEAKADKRRRNLQDNLHRPNAEQAYALIDQINTQMVDDETPFWAVVFRLVKEARAKADKGDVEPLREILERITGHDLMANLHHSRGKGRPKELSPIKQAVRDVRRMRAHYNGRDPRPVGDTLLQIAAKRRNVDIEQVRRGLDEKPPKPKMR
jgi:hypothetical protein